MSAVDATLLLVLIVAECGLLCAALLTVLGHGVAVRVRDVRDRRLLADVRPQVVAALHASPGENAATTLLTALPVRLRVRLLEEFLPGLGGAQRARLIELMAQTGLAARARGWCRSRSWWRRLQGVRLLISLHGGHDVVPALLDDGHADVRLAAVAWTAENPTPDVIDRLLGMLAGNRAERFAVKDALVRIGAPAVDPLTRFLAEQRDGPLEAGLEVARWLAEPRMLDAALRASHDPAPRVRALGGELAGAIGGERAVARLLDMTADTDPGVRASSVRAVATLGHWTSAPRVANLLRDPHWPVRREAALALATLGAPGVLLLRRALSDDDVAVRDIARQVLDLPERGARVSA